ncbi:MAG: bifunctional nuclease family protein [Nitrospinae bacterium]|nr:bifunctional nuclease family protein [Nitrospinota bacterium]
MRLKMVSSGFLVVLIVCIAHAHSVKAGAALSGLRRVEVKDILVDQSNDQPVLLLQEKKGGKLLPIWIGPAEARAIYMELEEAKPHRPMTHDLMRNLLKTLQAEVLRVVITEIKDMKAGGRRFSVDSRPSDAVALALRMKSPIYVKPVVMEHGFHMKREYTHPEKLGLFLQKLTPSLARFFGGGEASGLLVSDVKENAPAARAGLRRGDVILRLWRYSRKFFWRIRWR